MKPSLDRKVKGGGAILLNENGEKSDGLMEEGKNKDTYPSAVPNFVASHASENISANVV
jgi:hypothetical protein